MSLKISNLFYCFLSAFCLITLVSCDKEDNNSGNGDAKAYFNVVVSIDTEGSDGATYVQALEDISTGTISFTNYGFQVPCVRTARVYASYDGKILYNLNYGGGLTSKFNVLGGDAYSTVKSLDISAGVGTHPRWTKVNEDYALLHDVPSTTAQYDANENYTHHISEILLLPVKLDDFTLMNEGIKFEMPLTDEDKENRLHVWRIDAPVVLNGKAYYGLNKREYDPSTDKTNSSVSYSASTMIVDFPALTNPKVITSEVGKGSTQGYRTPTAHVDEKNDIYQITAAPSSILKISNGDYDNSYKLDLSAKLGFEVGSNGWFYVGNGIGYVPYYDVAKGSGSAAAAWGVARVDLYKGTVVKLDLPSDLWLQQYQYSITKDGKFYMALAPMGSAGNIYIFDTSSESTTGFTKGASLEKFGGTSTYIGIF